MSTPPAVDRTVYIASQSRQVHIVTATDDPWAYDLHWNSVAQPGPNDQIVADLVAFDTILDELKIDELNIGRKVVNSLWRAFNIDAIHAGVPIHEVERRRRWDAPK